MYFLNFLFFGCFLVLAVRVITAKGQREEGMVANPYLIATIFLFAIAVFARAYRFGSIPSGFNQDEAMAAVDAAALAAYGTDRFGMVFPVYFTAWGFAQMNVLESYLMVPFIQSGGLNEVTARMPMLLVNLLSLYVIYALCRKMWGEGRALSILFVLAVNPWHIMLSRWGLESNLYPAMLLFALFFLEKGMNKPLFLYISMFFFGLSMYAYGIAYFATPLLLLALASVMLSRGLVTPRRVLSCIVAFLVIAWPIFGVMAVNHFKLVSIETPFFTIPYFPDAVRTRDLLPFSENILRQAVDNLYAMLNVAFFQFPDTPWNAIPAFGPLYLFSMPLVFVGGHWLLKRPRENGSFMVLCWLATGAVAGIIVNNVNINRINILFLPMVILCGLGLHRIVTYCAERAGRFRAVGFLPVVAYAVAFAFFARAYFWPVQASMADSFYDGFGQAIAYAEEQGRPVMYVTAYTQYPGAYQVSEILTMFHAKTDALYFQGKAAGSGSRGEYTLPYSQRYRYVNFSELGETPLDAPDGVYIFNAREAHLFSETALNVATFGQYCVGLR